MSRLFVGIIFFISARIIYHFILILLLYAIIIIYFMQTAHLSMKTHLFEIKMGHLRDLCRSDEKVFWLGGAVTVPLGPIKLYMLLCVLVCVLWFRISEPLVYLQCAFAVLSIVANHMHLCWKKCPVRVFFLCRLVRICSELILVFAIKSSTCSQIYLLEREREKSIHKV